CQKSLAFDAIGWDVRMEETFPMACNFDVESCSNLRESHESGYLLNKDLERSIQTGINKWYQSLLRNSESKGNQEIRRRDAGNTIYKAKDNGMRPRKHEEPKALVTLDGDAELQLELEVTSWSKECKESYAKLKKLYDEQMEQLGVASTEIQAYDKTNELTYHKKLLAKAVKEKEELKTKLENFQSSSKGLSKLLNSQMNTRDKSGLGYGNQIHEGILSYEKEVLESVFDSPSSDVEDSHVNDRFVKVKGMHAVPPPMTGIYMPSKSDFGIDESKFTYGPKHRKSKVWSDAPIIEEYESDNGDEYVIEPLKEQKKPSFDFVNTVKHVKTLRETVKEQNTYSLSPKANKRDWNGLMSKNLGLGYGFTKKACFVCGSFSHLIRDCDFHEKRMAKQVELNKQKGKGIGQWENRPDDPQKPLKNKGIVYSGCSRHMTINKAYLVEYQDYNGGPIAFRGSKGYISSKGKIKTGKLDFEDVFFVKELHHFNLFSVSQMCDKKNKVLFTDTECLVLSPDFKLPDENKVLLRVPRKNNMYSFNLENIVPTGGLACLIAKATIDESNKWHRRLGHVNFKNLNKLVKGNLVRGLPSKIFQNDHTCVACQKGKQHKASCKAKVVSSISQPLQLLHMDLFGPTSVRSINHKTYCLVITDDFSRFSWVFFLRTKDEIGGILKDFIRQIENQLNQKVKTIRCDNGTEFKNRDIIELCGSKGIKREYSNARTPQQNRVAKRKNRTPIEAARTMLADLFLPNNFWAEVVSTACYVLNRVLVTKPQNKTPYELITGKIPIIGKGPNWLFDLDYLTNSMNYQLVTAENKANKTAGPKEANHSAGTQDHIDAENFKMEVEPAQEYFVLSLWSSYTSTVKSSKAKNGDEKPNGDTGPKINEEPKDQEDQAFLEELERLKRQEKEANDIAEAFRKEFAQCTEDLLLQAGAARATSTNTFNTVSTPISTELDIRRRTIDKTLFIKKDMNDIILVQVYVDDIIFGSTKRSEAVDMLVEGLPYSNETQKSLTKDEDAADGIMYIFIRSIMNWASLMYLTASRPDIMFAVCTCSRFQVNPKTSHLHAMKMIFSDYARAKSDRKSIIGGLSILAGDLFHGNARYAGTFWLLLLAEPGVMWDHSLGIAYEIEAYPGVEEFTLDDNVADPFSKLIELQSIAALVGGSFGTLLVHKTGMMRSQIMLLLIEGKYIYEASIRSSLLLNDAGDTACLTNEAIFQNLALMGRPTSCHSIISGLTIPIALAWNLVGSGGNEGIRIQLSIIVPHSGRVLALETYQGCSGCNDPQIDNLESRSWSRSAKPSWGTKEHVSKQRRKLSNQDLLDAFDDLVLIVARFRKGGSNEEQSLMLLGNIGCKAQIERDAEIALKVQAELDEEARLERQRQEQASLNYIANLSSDVEDSPVYDRFAKVEGMHAVPPPMTGNYMPPKSDFGIDESNFTYGLKQSKTSESDAKTSDFDSCETNSSVETLESVPEPVVVEPKVVSQPKVWSDAPIIEEYESDSDDEYVIEPSKEQEKPSFAFVNTVKHVKTPRETVKEQNTCSPSPKVNKRDWNGLMSKKLGLGYGFTKKACFVCGSFSHLIRDCDFHEKRMAKQVELNKQKGKGTGQGENRPVWNNVQRLNHQNKFVPKVVLTKTGIFPVNAARQNPFSQAAETSTARKANTARPIVNEIGQRNNFYKSHSPIRRPFNKSIAPKANFTNHKVNTAGDKTVSVIRGYRETVVKTSAGCNWRPKRHYWNKVSKYNSGSNSNKNDDPQKALKNKGIVDSGCSRHMTGNKAYLVEYQKLYGSQLTMLYSKELASPKQTTLALAIPEQTATGKEISNPFMAEAKEFQVYRVTKEFKFIKEQIKEYQCVWIHPPSVQEAQTKET
ncbi:putative ribonuclease H-like domain-containing protein, partial [Tanacetum coccineum]